MKVSKEVMSRATREPETVQDIMIRFRKKNGMSEYSMARICKVPVGLIRILEEGGVTHPNIVRRVKAAYMLTNEQAKMLLPRNYRKGTPDYDPDRYKSDGEFGEGVVARV